MNQPSVLTPNSGLRVFSACLLSALLIVMPFVQFAAAEGYKSALKVQTSNTGRQTADSRPQDGTANNTSATSENVFLNAPVPKPAPEPAAPLAPVIVATKTDNVLLTSTVNPGDTITYTVNIANNGVASPADDATGVQFTDMIDAHTTLVPGSPIAAASDKYNTIGNVQITIPDGTTDLLGNDFDPDTGNNAGMTVTAETKSSTNCTGGCSNNVTINANGSFTYNPPLGFTGTDTFTYTAISGSSSLAATVTITVANEIWFINNASSCVSNCGSLAQPFPSLAAFNAANLGGAGQPGDNDWIFVFESGTPYTGPATLRLGQKFIGQDATASLISLTAFTQPSGTDPLPVMAPANGVIVNITGTNVNGINLNSGNLLRGFTVGDVGTGTKISGSSFGTLTVGNNASPDVTLNGTGRALSLTTGTLSTAGGFVSVATTSSANQGINLSGVADSDGAGGNSFSFGSTTVGSSTSEGILVSGSTADLNFGATSVTGGTDGVSLQNNSAGTRTFSTLGISSGSGIGFRHFDPDGGGVAVGGGAVTVSGAMTVTNPTGNGIDIDSSNANISFAATTVSKNNAGIGVDLTANATRTISFASLAVTTTTGFAINTNNSGTVNVTTGSLTQSGAGGGAASLTNTTLGMTFTTVSSDGGANGLLFSGGTGSFISGTTNLQNNAGIGLSMSSTAVNANFGNTTVNSSAGDAIDLSSTTGTVTFAALNLTPDANLRGLDSSNSTGTITSTSGTITTTDAVAVNISGPAGLTPLSLVLTSVSTDNTGTANSGVSITNASGTANMQGGALVGGTSSAFAVSGGSANITYAGTVTQNSAARVVDIQGTTSGTVSFTNTGTAVTGGSSSLGVHIGDTSAVNGNVTFAELNLGTSGARMTNQAVTITNGGSGATYSMGAMTIFTNNAQGMVATNADGTINCTSTSTVDSSNATAINIDGPGGLTTLGLTLTRVDSTGGAATGITLQDTSGSFTISGTGGTCTNANTTGCSGGTIASKTGADNSSAAPLGTGIVLNNATNVSLTRMWIHDHSNYGIRGTSVTGFTLDNSVLNGTNGTDLPASAGSPFNEGTIKIDNLAGSATISNTFISGGISNNVRIDNTTTTVNRVTFTNDTIGANSTANGEDGILLESENTGRVLATIQNTTFTSARGDLFNFVDNAASGSADDLIFNNNTLSNNHPAIATGGGGVTISSNGTKDFTFHMENNTMRDAVGHAVLLVKSTGAASYSGTFTGNTIGLAATNNSGSKEGSGLKVQSAGQGTVTVAITNNQIHQYNNFGIELLTGGGAVAQSGAFNAIITGNTIDTPGNTAGTLGIPKNGIHLNGGTVPGDTFAICTQIGGAGALANSIATSGKDAVPPTGAGDLDFRLRQRQSTTVRLPGYGGANNDNTAVQNFIIANNSGNGAPVGQATNTVPTGGGFVGGAACTSPVTKNYVPRAPQNEYVASTINFEDIIGAALTAAANTREASGSADVSQASFMTPIASGLTSAASETGARWAPAAAVHSTEMQRSETNRADIRDQQSDVRRHHATTAKAGVRTQESGVRAHHARNSKLETRNSKLAAVAVPMAGETVAANIGTLPAGGSVTITFQVTINNPPNLTLLTPNPRVENQGTVSGGNFANVLTDDPETGTGGDKTATRINLFDTTTNLTCTPDPSNSGEQVTCTATVNETPAQGAADPSGTVDFIDTSNGNAIICDNATVTAGQATCQTSALTAGTHNIRADYSGDGNFDPSQSATYPQDVIACTTNPVVTSTADSGASTLREAITNACGGTTITFDIPGPGPHTITLLAASGALIIDKNLTINNSSGESVTVSGAAGIRVFNINSGKTVAISNLTIANGAPSGVNFEDKIGGGILNQGTLTLTNVTVSGNTAAEFGGGGIYNLSGTLSLTNSLVSGNHALNGGAGGGIFNNFNGTLNLTNSTVSGNDAVSGGGGVQNDAGTMTVVTSTISGNTANFGGGIQNFGTLTVTNSTISGNNANTDGGGIFNNHSSGSVTLTSVTVTNNGADADNNAAGTGGGIFVFGTSLQPLVRNTIVSGNFNEDGASDAADDLVGTINGTSSFNLIANATPGLGPLTKNGGPTQTHALQPTSPAIDKGDAFGLTTDQRGEPRPVDDASVTNASDGSDIGAFEFALAPEMDVSGNGNSIADGDTTPSATDGTDFGTALIAGGTVDRVFTITNSGGALLNLTGTPKVVIGGTHAADFSVTVDPITPVASGGGTTTFTVRFDPSAAGVRTASLSIANDDSNENPYNFDIQGNGANAIPSVTVNIVDAALNDADNSSDVTITFSEPPVGFTSSDVTSVNGNVTGLTATADPLVFNATFTAADGVSGTGSVSVTAGSYTNAGGDPGTGGTDTVAIDTLNPTVTVDIVDTSLNDADNSSSVTITFSEAPVGFTSGDITDTNGTVSGLSATADPLVFTATFTADDGFSGTGSVSVTAGSYTDAAGNSGGGGSDTVAIDTTNAPEIDVSGNGNVITDGDTTPSLTDHTDFDAAAVGGGVITRTFTVRNTGTAGLNLPGTPVTISGANAADFSVTVQPSTPVASGGGTTTFSIQFDPSALGLRTASVSIANDDADENPYNFDIQGTGTATVDVSVQDAQAGEPMSGSVNMIFTVTLNAPAPAGGGSVQYQTVELAPALNHATAGTCGTPNADYQTVPLTTLNFAAGEQFKTVAVTICADTNAGEPNETFEVQLSNPVNLTIADGTATGTITTTNTAGALLISELRTSGPGGAGDDFVEIYNNTDSPHTVNGSGGGGYGLFKMGATCSDAPVLIGVIPNGTVIPARGHFLFTGSAYSLANYGGTGAAAGDQTMAQDIENDRNVAIFSTASLAGISSANRFDAVGFGANTGGICDLFREGTTLVPVSGSTLEYSYFRKQCDWIQGQGCTVPSGNPKDTNNNGVDFWFADTTGAATPAGQRLGAPGPENLSSPIQRTNAAISVALLDGNVATSAHPNRTRSATPEANATFGTMTLRHRITNNTGAPVTRLRYRIVDLSTASASAGIADLRALTGTVATINPVTDSVTCTSQALSTPCAVTVQATTLEQPPNQSLGGGYNATLSSGTIGTGTPLPPGASILVSFKLGVEQTGTFRFLIIVEALP